jgi:hypothetical protein
MGRKVEGAMVQYDGPTVRKSLGPGPPDLDLRTFGLDLRTPHRRPVAP